MTGEREQDVWEETSGATAHHDFHPRTTSKQPDVWEETSGAAAGSNSVGTQRAVGKSSARRTLGWLAAAAIGLSAFLYGAIDSGTPRTDADRVHSLGQRFGCPVCDGQSVAKSDAVVARNIRAQIAERVDEGATDEAIIAELEAIFPGNDYTPPASGLWSLIWILPVVFGVCGIGGLVLVHRRWSLELTQTDEPTAEAATQTRQRFTKFAVWALVILALATLAGVVLANFSGSRRTSEQITGDNRPPIRTRLFNAREAMGAQDLGQATEIYADVLRDDPSNAEALTYLGWLTNLSGNLQTGLQYLQDAITADPEFPDARVFLASVLLAEGDPLAASDQLSALDRIDAPPFISQLVDSQGLEGNVAAAAGVAAGELVAPLLAGQPFDSDEVPVRYVVLAADHFAANGQVDDGLALHSAMLSGAPDDVDVIVAFSWFVARASVGSPEAMATARAYLDRAITAEPLRPDALVYRAFVNLQLEDIESARADLHAYDALDVIRRDLDRLIINNGLRQSLS